MAVVEQISSAVAVACSKCGPALNFACRFITRLPRDPAVLRPSPPIALFVCTLEKGPLSTGLACCTQASHRALIKDRIAGPRLPESSAVPHCTMGESYEFLSIRYKVHGTILEFISRMTYISNYWYIYNVSPPCAATYMYIHHTNM